MSKPTEDEVKEMLRGHYFLRPYDPDLSRGRRSNLYYAIVSATTGFSRINAVGPDPVDYIAFARADLEQGDERGNINAFGNAKRAVHQAVEGFVKIYRLDGALGSRASFPSILNLLSELGAFPVNLVASLNRRRNQIEHDYVQASSKEVISFVEVAELFVTLAYLYLRDSAIGVYFSQAGTDECKEVLLDPYNGALLLYRVQAPLTVRFDDNVVHYNIKRDDPRELVETIPVKKGTRDQWLPFIDLFVFCTRKRALRLSGIAPPGMLVPSREHFEITDVVDENDRRKFVTHRVSEMPEHLIGQARTMGNPQ